MFLVLKNLLFTIFVPGTIAVYIPVFVLPHDPAQLSVSAVAGGSILIIGGAIYLWCLWDFASSGRGTPAPIDPPKHLVVRGLYRYTRNPMYVGVVGVIFGWALWFSAAGIAIYGVSVGAFFHLFIVFYEEPHLRRTFGSSYEDYCRHVSRWLPFRHAT